MAYNLNTNILLK